MWLVFVLACAPTDRVPKEDSAIATVEGDCIAFPWKCDDDGDGYAEMDADCDDVDASINPGATEICDGIDNNCDGYIDEDLTAPFYADLDEDGFGDPDASLHACEQPTGYLENSTDCNDAEPLSFPGNPEICDSLDNNCDGQIDEGVSNTYFADADADGFGDVNSPQVSCETPSGYVSDSSDCDDTTGTVNPAEPEVCDEHDNDCNGFVDDGVTIPFYADFDADGWGDADVTQDACALPTGYATESGDCDDSNPYVSPDGMEVCNSIDDDCDSLIDEDAADALTYYADADGDTYGDAAVTTSGCTLPAGYVTNTLDCDDGLASVSPVSDEVCNDIDDDCDGSVDEADAIDGSTWYLDYDSDGYGGTLITAVACDAPAHYVASADDCDDTESGVNPGATEVCNGIDDDCDGTLDNGAPGTVWYRDADSDGYGDLAATTTDCTAPAGYVADATDCDDGVAAVNPAATEVCDGTDDDCNGIIDDGAAGSYTFYADADADGYGDSSTTIIDCAAPSGYVSNDDDCDDGDAAVHAASAETCDGADEDCDGAIDNGGVCPCDTETHGSSTYLFCAGSTDWNSANTACRSYGYELITIDDASENTFAVDEGISRGWTANAWVAWIGLNDQASEGSYVWSSGGGSGYTNWNSGEPNNSGNEDCTELYTAYTWNDLPCSYSLQYICEVE